MANPKNVAWLAVHHPDCATKIEGRPEGPASNPLPLAIAAGGPAGESWDATSGFTTHGDKLMIQSELHRQIAALSRRPVRVRHSPASAIHALL